MLLLGHLLHAWRASRRLLLIRLRRRLLPGLRLLAPWLLLLLLLRLARLLLKLLLHFQLVSLFALSDAPCCVFFLALLFLFVASDALFYVVF